MRTLCKLAGGVLAYTLLFCANAGAQATPQADTWKFAVSGDSRNCGDIVMPAIAKGVLHDGASFYWHLGDYRAIYTFDEDYRATHPQATISSYFADAWPDFIKHQLNPFGELPVFLAPGNHEMVPPMNRQLYLAQFADWLDKPVLQQQRLADNPADHMLKSYNHWIQGGVDFISMDNASPDMFDAGQMSWFSAVLGNAAKNPAVRTVVLGMHATLPEGLSTGHSMNDSPQQESTGRKVYAQLVAFRHDTGKNVYVLASHSHFVLNNVYDTECTTKDTVLPGWVIGSAGAVRYRLPQDHAVATVAKTNVYGYLLGTVTPDGKIDFAFREISESDIPADVVTEFSQKQVDWCFNENRSNYVPGGPICPCTQCAK